MDDGFLEVSAGNSEQYSSKRQEFTWSAEENELGPTEIDASVLDGVETRNSKKRTIGDQLKEGTIVCSNGLSLHCAASGDKDIENCKMCFVVV